MSKRVYFNSWGQGLDRLHIPAYAIITERDYGPADAVYRAIASANRLHVCAGPRSEGTSLPERDRHYCATLGAACRGGGYTPEAEVWVSIPAESY